MSQPDDAHSAPKAPDAPALPKAPETNETREIPGPPEVSETRGTAHEAKADPMPDSGFAPRDAMWQRFLFMALFLLLFAIAETVLWLVSLGQFAWMLFNSGRPNDNIAEFGARLGVWLKRVALYQSGTTDEKPFPWREID